MSSIPLDDTAPITGTEVCPCVRRGPERRDPPG
jgi:hypothetical protein